MPSRQGTVSANSAASSRESVVPVGLLGDPSSTIFASRDAPTSSSSRKRNSPELPRSGTSTTRAPSAFACSEYSEKEGSATTTVSPGSTQAKSRSWSSSFEPFPASTASGGTPYARASSAARREPSVIGYFDQSIASSRAQSSRFSSAGRSEGLSLRCSGTAAGSRGGP